MWKSRRFPSYLQMDEMDCGSTCVGMVAEYYGRKVPLEQLRQTCASNRDGVSLQNLVSAFDSIAIEAFAIESSLAELINEIPLPAIAHWENDHFVVVYKATEKKVSIADPQLGKISYPPADFREKWTNASTGILLLCEPKKDFSKDNLSLSKESNVLNFLFKYLANFSGYYLQLAISLVVTSIIEFSLPFLTQSLVDEGIGTLDLSLIQIILVTQISLLCFLLITEVLREWMLMHLSIRLNISMISDFLDKLMEHRFSYFHSKTVGDFMQRIYDNLRVDNFLGKRLLILPFDIVTLITFGAVLLYFNLNIFLVVLLGTGSLLVWSLLFNNRKRAFDHANFKANQKEQSILLQMIMAIREIKLNGSSERRRMEWKSAQVAIFKTQLGLLKTDLYQLKGGEFIKSLMAIIIIYWSALEVIKGTMSLGTMLAIQFIIAGMSIPLHNILSFIVEFQRAFLAIERISEIHETKIDVIAEPRIVSRETAAIEIRNISFSYRKKEKEILKDFSLNIPANQITAIVGSSGSGKTTLIHLLLKLYDPTSGSIYIGRQNLLHIDPSSWRIECGCVLQDGIIFNDTIERNITESRSHLPVDYERLDEAVRMACLEDMIGNLPMGQQTVLGLNGQLLSGGERQRILIARMIYGDPQIIFFDEATASLDAATEKKITTNLQKFFKQRTVIIVAHRLSTIKNADTIVVMDNGRSLEIGSHESLLKNKGAYYNLFMNQL